jgi:putative tryptophan/tyrosine transport system substrate-binding protein
MNTEPIISSTRPTAAKVYGRGHVRWGDALWDPTSGKSQVAMTETAARAMNIQLQILEVRHRDHLADAFAAAREAKAQAINVFASPFLASLTREIIGLAAEHRLSAIYQWREQVEAGGLVSYGPCSDVAAGWRLGCEASEGRKARRFAH